jgi:cytochrome b561
MPLKNTANRYGSLARFFHWTIVLLIILQYVLITYAKDLPQGAEKMQFYTWHKSVGVTVLVLAILRLLWRFMNQVPELPRHMNLAEVMAARLSHYALYVLIFAIPLSGYLMSIAGGHPVSYFGWFDLPALVGENRNLSEFMNETHETLFYVLVAVAAVHILAALKHHLWNKDDVLKRMLPFGRPEGDPDRRD